MVFFKFFIYDLSDYLITFCSNFMFELIENSSIYDFLGELAFILPTPL